VKATIRQATTGNDLVCDQSIELDIVGADLSDLGVDVVSSEALVAVGRLHGSAVNWCISNPLKTSAQYQSIGAMTARSEWQIVAVDPVVENPACGHRRTIRQSGSGSLLRPARAAIDTVAAGAWKASLTGPRTQPFTPDRPQAPPDSPR
jgi:hypothetical protein